MKTPDGRSYKSTVWHQRVHTTYKKWSGRRSCGTDSRSHHLLPAGVDSFGPVCSFEGRQGANIDAPDIWTAACAKKKIHHILSCSVHSQSSPTALRHSVEYTETQIESSQEGKPLANLQDP